MFVTIRAKVRGVGVGGTTTLIWQPRHDYTNATNDLNIFAANITAAEVRENIIDI